MLTSFGIGYNPFYHDGFYLYERFREEHRRKFKTDAYVSPHMRWKWCVPCIHNVISPLIFVRKLGENVSEQEVQESLSDLTIFQRWFSENVMTTNNESGSTAVMILPVGLGKPVYRDVQIEPKPRFGMDPLNFGAFLRLPQIVIPSEYLVSPT